MTIEALEEVFYDPDRWCKLSVQEHRTLLAEALGRKLGAEPGVTGAAVQLGPVERPYDLTAALETDVGTLRTPLWSNARAAIFCDPSIHAANRRQLAPGLAVAEAVERLRRRLNVPFTLESRGLTVTLSPEPGVERVWSAERSMLRGKTAVSREDRIVTSGEVDLRDLLARFYSGPALRLVGAEGRAFLLPAAVDDADAVLLSLCLRCRRWADGARQHCDECGAQVDVVAASRSSRR